MRNTAPLELTHPHKARHVFAAQPFYELVATFMHCRRGRRTIAKCAGELIRKTRQYVFVDDDRKQKPAKPCNCARRPAANFSTFGRCYVAAIGMTEATAAVAICDFERRCMRPFLIDYAIIHFVRTTAPQRRDNSQLSPSLFFCLNLKCPCAAFYHIYPQFPNPPEPAPLLVR